MTLASYLMVESLLRGDNICSMLQAATATWPMPLFSYYCLISKTIHPWAFYLVLIHKPVRQTHVLILKINTKKPEEAKELHLATKWDQCEKDSLSTARFPFSDP